MAAWGLLRARRAGAGVTERTWNTLGGSSLPIAPREMVVLTPNGGRL